MIIITISTITTLICFIIADQMLKVADAFNQDDDIEEEISLHSIDFDKQNTLMFIKHFLKFLNDADLNYIKYKISWKFLHSSWN